MRAFDPSFLLFVPGDRPERFSKAASSQAGGIILDLEDAVAGDHKSIARDAVAAYLKETSDTSRIAVRVNATNTPWVDEDLAMLRRHRLGAIVLPKVSDATILRALTNDNLADVDCIALIESASGILHAAEIAAQPGCIALAFGPYDLAADLGGNHEWESMLPYRAGVLVAARAHRKLAIDGPTLSFTDLKRTETEARAAMRLGYDGKLLIHPAQIETAQKAFRPSEREISHASQIIEAAKDAMPAVVDGVMIDEPLLIAARRILRRGRVYTP